MGYKYNIHIIDVVSKVSDKTRATTPLVFVDTTSEELLGKGG